MISLYGRPRVAANHAGGSKGKGDWGSCWTLVLPPGPHTFGAKNGESQETLDEMHGRTRIVPSHVLHQDGSQHDNIASMAFRQGTGAMTMFAIGKKAAGRLLDGQLHDAVPRGRDNDDDTRQETPA